MSRVNNDPVKPFLKWAGGKYKSSKIIEHFLPEHIRRSKSIEHYFEPFVGGGGLFFYLSNNYSIKHAYINDINKELVLTYNVIKNDVDSLIGYLEDLQKYFIPLSIDDRKVFYFDIRKEFNKNLIDFDYDNYSENHIIRASQVIFMNKTCFNGLFRVNKNAEFNVPMGRYKNPTILDESNLKKVSLVLKNTEIHNGNYSYIEELIEDNSLIYFDPPYKPLTKTSSFTSYSENHFGDLEQIELAKFCQKISNEKTYIILSNSDPKNVDVSDNFFDDLYSQFRIHRIKVPRSINSNANKRGKISEILVTNNYDYWCRDYMIHIDKKEIENTFRDVKFIEEPKVPFPQADKFQRIICICEHLLGGEMSGDEITELNEFTSRQKDYYTNAAIYLSLIEKFNKGKKKFYKLSDRGKFIFELNEYQRDLELCKCLFEHSLFHHVFDDYFSGKDINLDIIVEMMHDHQLYNVNSSQLYKRRGKTVLSWFNWVIDHFE